MYAIIIAPFYLIMRDTFISFELPIAQYAKLMAGIIGFEPIT